MYGWRPTPESAMKTRLASATLFALYQLSLVTGLLLLPIAVLANRVGVTIPVHRLLDRVQHAYESR